ncbi:MAG: G8 domain-containing protein, partial [Pseudomonadota bacterium]
MDHMPPHEHHSMSGPVLWSELTTQADSEAVEGADVIIPEGMHVVLDVDTADLGTLVVHGVLEFGQADVTLTADNVVVFGEMKAGSEDAPHLHRAEIVLTGQATDPDIVLADWAPAGGDMGHGAHGSMGHMHMNDALDSKALIVAPGGTLSLHGLEKTSWTLLQTDAEAGASTIEVQDADGWQVGDVIVIAPTDLDAFEVEERTITAIEGTTITFDAPIEHAHTGHDMALDNGTVLELRAEVANLSRNIRIEGSDDGGSRVLATTADNPEHVGTADYGGHTMFIGDAQVQISDVEFTQLGISGELGRYPVHFHHAGDASGSYIKDSAVHHVFQRGIVVHQTDNALFEGNTVYDTLGHGIYLEDGVETGNRFEDNLVMLPRSVPPELVLAELGKTDERASGFWVTNPSNEFEGNHVAGVPGGMGFWFHTPDHNLESIGLSKTDPRRHEPLLQFEDNTAHSIDFDRGIGKNLAYANGWTGVALDLGGLKNVLSGKTLDHAPIEGFTAWKIGNIAVAMNTTQNPAQLIDPVLAEARVIFESDSFGGDVAIDNATIIVEIPDGSDTPDWPSQHPGRILLHSGKEITFNGLEIYEDQALLGITKSSHSDALLVLQADAAGEGLTEYQDLNQWLEPDDDSVDAALYGYGGDDLIVGDNSDNLLVGGAGDDTLGGHGGNDTLVGGKGDDVLTKASWRSRPEGPNNDIFFAGRGDDLVDVGNGNGTSQNTVIYRRGDGSDQSEGFASGVDKVVLVGFEESDLDQDGDGDFDDLDLANLSTDSRDGRFLTREVALGDGETLSFTAPANGFALSAGDFGFAATVDDASDNVQAVLALDVPPPVDEPDADDDPEDHPAETPEDDPMPETVTQFFEAEDFDATQGVGIFNQGGNTQIGATRDGEWVRYQAVDFGDDPNASREIELKLSSGSQGGTLEIRAGAPDGALLASHTTGNTGGWASYDTV